MTVSIVASDTVCLGVVSSGAPASISFNPTTAAQLLVVAIGWATGTATAPLVTFGEQIMTQVASNVIDTSEGAMALYTLAVSNPTAGTITIAPPGFLGNTQAAIFAYDGTTQTLGVISMAEYGTSSSGVDTGSTTIDGVTAGSAVVFAGMTFFGGTPSAIDASAGWTAITASTATNEGVFPFWTTESGDLSITVTPSPSSFFTMLVMVWEVLAGSPPGSGSGVNLVSYDAVCLGIISSAVPGTLTFDPTTSANYLVAMLGWASSSPLTPPSVSFGSNVMSIVTSPITVDDGNGAVAIYVLPLNTGTGVQTVTVNSAPNYAGYTSIVIAAYSNTSQQLGVLSSSEYGSHDAGVLTGTTEFSGIATSSAFMFGAFTFFGTTPSSMDYSAEWTNIASTSATDQSVWAYNKQEGESSFSITLENTTTYFNTLNYGYEVLVAGTALPSSTVQVTASQISYLGGIGLNPTTVNFDTAGAELLVVCSSRSNNFPEPPTFTYADIPLQFVSSPAINDATIGASMDIAFLANPPSGSQQLTGTGPSGFIGDTVVMVVGLSNLSGVAGMRATYSNQGDSASVTLGACDETGSLVLAFVASPFTFNTEVPNYGWETIQSNAGTFIYTWLMSAIGGANLALYLTNSAFAKTQTIVLEFEKALTGSPGYSGGGGSSVPTFQSSGDGNAITKLTPNGQTYHVYWDSWLDQPMKEVSAMQPDDFYLARIPNYVAAVCLSFAVPQCSYAGIDSNIKATVGLNFPGSVTLLQQTIALLKSRNPTIKVLLAVQQNTPEQSYPDPYMTAWPGWGGMTSTHVANIQQFLTDTNMDGVVIDYECLDSNSDVAYHCEINQTTGIPSCYTDTEFVSVVNLMRTGLPRPWIMIVDGFSVGAYVGDYYFAGQPVGYNSGYMYCISQNAEALAAMDGIHIESYDAGDLYDPRIAARAYQALFPDVPIWIGCRVGPAEYEGVKRTAFDFVDYCNTAIMLGLGGVQLYSWLWDVIPPPGLNNPLSSGAPFGNYGPDFPDAGVCSTAVAQTLDLGSSSQEGTNVDAIQIGVSLGLMRGLRGPI